MAKGQKKYDKGDRMGALKLWEQALSRVCTLHITATGPLQNHEINFLQDPTVEDRQAALFNSTCVHASFGDVEFAQVTLRGTLDAPQCKQLCILEFTTRP